VYFTRTVQAESRTPTRAVPGATSAIPTPEHESSSPTGAIVGGVVGGVVGLIVILFIVLYCLRRKKKQQPLGRKRLSARAELDGTSRGNQDLPTELKHATSPAAQSIAPAYDTIMAQTAHVSPPAGQPYASYFPVPVDHSPLTPHTPTYSHVGHSNSQFSPEHQYHQLPTTQSQNQQYAYQRQLYGQRTPLQEQRLHASEPLPYSLSGDPNHRQHFPPPHTPVNASSIAHPPYRAQHSQGGANTLPERHPSSSSAYTDSMYAEPPTQTNTPARFYPGQLDVAAANSDSRAVGEWPRSAKRSPGLGTGGGRFLEGD